MLNVIILKIVSLIPLWGSLGFLAGIAIVSIGMPGVGIVVAAAIGGSIAVIVLIRQKFGAFAILFLAVLLGLWYGHMQMYPSVSSSDVVFYASSGPRVGIEGRVSEEARAGSRNVQIVVNAERIYMEGADKAVQVNGKVLAFVPVGSRVVYGDSVAVSGKLEKPGPFESFDYPRYLARRGITAVIFNAEVMSLDTVPPRDLFSFLIQLRQHLRSVLSQLLRGSPAEIVGAMTLGYGRELSDETGQVLARAGIRHLTAISGMHVMLIIEMLLGILLYFGWRRQWAIGGALAIILLFVLLVGFPASAVRAGIMGGVLYVGQIFGRPLNSLRLLMYAAVAMLIWNPYLLSADIGFQLSFSAMFGILTLTPFFEQNLSRILSWRGVRRIMSMSLAATLFTFPLVLYHFGLLSWVGIFVNLIAIPLLPLILMLAFFMLGAGSISLGLGAVLSWPLWFIVSLLFSVASFVSSLPFAALTIPPHSLAILIVGYALLAAFVMILIRRGYNPILASSNFLTR